MLKTVKSAWFSMSKRYTLREDFLGRSVGNKHQKFELFKLIISSTYLSKLK